MRHQHISFFKSGMRILGYVLMYKFSFTIATVLIFSELIGIVEEFGHE
jgi:hypothetical protein